MKVCPSCNSEFDQANWLCEVCNWEPARSKGVFQFAPHISGATESYDPSWYAELASLEAHNFWFIARNRLIRWLARRSIPQNGKYLEVGCGTGFVLQMLCKTLQRFAFYATEVQPEGIEFAKKRVPKDVTFFQMDACAIPFRNEFDAIGAFDVIEHIRHDVTAIEQIHDALKPGGIFILSVPQHMFLWSKFDEVGCHFRRYSANELKHKLEASGFSILTSMSFNSLLLPLMTLSRQLKKKETEEQLDVLAELRLSRFTNLLLSSVLKIEFLLIRLGLKFPMGGSRIIVAKKKSC